MAYYGFEYFCGANVTVRIEDFPILECAGISYTAHETKIPLYGYSSRHFDAVGRGRYLVTGTMLVNFVHQDYMFKAVETAVNRKFQRDTYTLPNIGREVSDRIKQEGLSSILQDTPEGVAFQEAMKNKFWRVGADAGNLSQEITGTNSLVDEGSGLDIKIVFGEQDSAYAKNGKTGVLLQSVFFTSRGKAIRVDEETIVEAYEFFARQEHSIRNPSYVDVSTPQQPIRDFDPVREIKQKD